MKIQDIILHEKFGGGCADWDFLDRLLDNMASVGYYEEEAIEYILDDEVDNMNSFIYTTLYIMGRQFATNVEEYAKDNGIEIDWLELNDEITDSIYCNYLDSGFDIEYKDFIYENDVEGFIEYIKEEL